MTVAYVNGILTFTPDANEKPVLDYIFSRVDGEPLVLFHLNSLISQRRAQSESETKEQLFAQLQSGQIQLAPVTLPVKPIV